MDVQALRRIVEGMMSSLAVPKLRWATVVQASPLRIQYPIESEPLPFEPTYLGPKPGLGASVLTVQWGTRITILGAVGQGGREALGPGVNLNTLVEWKVYTQDQNANAASGTNYPVPLAGALEVLPVADGSGSYVWQRYTTYRHTAAVGGEEIGPAVYVRSFYSGAWSPWVVVGGEPRIAGVKSAKTYYEKYPDGRLICRGSHSFPANANTRQTYAWTYPVAFVGELPHVTHTASSTVPQNISTGYSAETLTSVTMEFYRTTGSATGVMFQAEGRWK